MKRADRSTPTRNQKSYRIGEVTRLTGLSADTLRCYEKIGLLPRVGRNPSGIRRYNDTDLSRLRFIQRAQVMDFGLADIAQLLKMRESPRHARAQVRELTRKKLTEVGARLEELKTLRNELQLLLDLCNANSSGCPIITDIERRSPASSRRKALWRQRS